MVMISSFTLSHVRAQSTVIERKTDAVAKLAIHYLNANFPDSVYQLLSQHLQEKITPVLWRSMYKNQVSKLLPFTAVVFIQSKDSINKYKLKGKSALTYYVSLDKQNKLANFSFVPFQEEVKPSSMTGSESKTDLLAQKVLKLISHKQADSIYLFAGDNFKSQIDAAKWRSISEMELFPLTPLPEATFLKSKDGINKYKLNQYQFLFGAIDEHGKFNMLALQPFKKDQVKAVKPQSDNSLKNHLDSVVEKVLSPYIQTQGNVGLSAGIFYKGKEYFYNYGETRLGNSLLPTRQTIYDIGSITKTFTTTLLAITVNMGKITLETPITKFLPDSVSNNSDLKDITFKELANHTSGLPRLPDNFERNLTDLNQPYQNYHTKEMFSFLKHFKLIRKAGIKYEYSNFAVGLLGVLLERIHNKPYQTLIRQYVTGPANLNRTEFSIDAFKSDLIAQGYDEHEIPVPVWNFAAFQAAGALKSCASDLLAYSKLQLFSSDHTLHAGIKLTHQVTFNDSTNILGLGWHFLSGDQKVIQHGGGTGGYRSMICVNLDRQLSVVILTNNASTGDALGIELIKALEGTHE